MGPAQGPEARRRPAGAAAGGGNGGEPVPVGTAGPADARSDLRAALGADVVGDGVRAVAPSLRGGGQSGSVRGTQSVPDSGAGRRALRRTGRAAQVERGRLARGGASVAAALPRTAPG